jgi:hypothetical protein
MGIYLFNHRQRGKIMALRSKQSQINEDFEVEEVKPTEEKVSFDDLEYDAEFVDEEEETEPTVYYTISGKEQQYEPTWESYKIGDLDVGDEFEGRPEITIFENKDKTYDAMRLRIMDDGEILNLYMNFPKKDWPYVKGINKSFDFYRNCFNFIFGILRWRDETNVVDEQGEEVNRFNRVNIETFMKYLDQMDRVGVRITEGENGYNNWILTKME